MARSNLLVSIRMAYDDLTKLEKKVADYVLSNPQTAMKMTIADLARHCGVGDTTVFRFCRSMDLSGYQDFKLSLALSTHANELLDNQENIPVVQAQDLEQMAQHVSNVFTSTVSETLSSLDYSAVFRTVDALLSANSIHLYGFGNSGIAALFLQNRLMRVLPNTFYSSDAHMQLTSAALLKPDSVAIVFCNSGITRDSLKIAEMAHTAGAMTIFVTKFLETPARAYSDIILPCGATEGPMQGGSVATIASQLFIVGLLYSEVIRRLDHIATQNKIKTSEAIAAKKL